VRRSGGHFLGVHDVNAGGAFVGKGDGDALAADVIEIDMIFLLDAFAQVLDGHVLLGELDFEGAAAFLKGGEGAALVAQ